MGLTCEISTYKGLARAEGFLGCMQQWQLELSPDVALEWLSKRRTLNDGLAPSLRRSLSRLTLLQAQQTPLS